MDSLNYGYQRDGSGNLVNNRLDHVNDAISSGNYTIDIDDQAANNYIYDHIGNLKKDVAEDIDTIHWTVYGKINRIVKNGGSMIIDYGYDPGGNRVYKKVKVEDTVTTTYYIRDASGNVMGIYTQNDEDVPKWSEQHLYGSSRLGIWKWDADVPASPPIVTEEAIFDSLMFGMRQYELSNHLGNVLSTISDKKVGHDSSGVVDYYVAEVLSQSAYYPFGMGMPGRQYSVASGYRYGFNGQEKSTEVFEGSTTAEFWQYDSRIGRRWNLDPVCKPNESPYLCFSGNPVWFSDINGDDSDPPGQPKKAPDLRMVSTVENVLKGKKFIAYHSEIELPKKGFWNKLFGRTEKRSDAQCADYARCQVKQGNGSPTAVGSDKRVDTYIDETRQTDKSKLNLQNGVDIIVSNLKQGNAVMVGVMYNPTKSTGNPNAATNHYVTIVGMGTDKEGVYFSYYDNYTASTGESVATDLSKNKFRLSVSSTGTYYFVDKDNNIPLNGNREVKIGDKDANGNPLNARYIMTEVRPNSGGASSNSSSNSGRVPAYEHGRIM